MHNMGLTSAAANIQESKSASWAGVAPCVVEAAQREREGAQDSCLGFQGAVDSFPCSHQKSVVSLFS